MSGIFGPGDRVQGPSGEYSGAGPGGKVEAGFTSVADGPGGYGADPTPAADGSGGYGADPTVLEERGQHSEVSLTWEQRVLRLLSGLSTVKGFKSLPPQMRDEVHELIDEAPDEAYL